MLLPPKLQVALNIISVFFAAFFMAPTIAIVASWNALPGEQLYPTKRTLERIALAITSPNYQTNSSLQTKLIARRTNEAADDILKKSSTKGLDELRLQAAALRKQIAQAPNPKAKRVAATQAVNQLRQARTKLQQTRRTLTYTPPVIQTSPTSPTPPTSEKLADDIEDTEEDIDDTIEDIEDDPDVGEVPQEPSPSPTPTPTPGTNPLFGPQGDTNTNDTENNDNDRPGSSPPGQQRPQGDNDSPTSNPQGPSTPQDASPSSI